MKYNEEQFAAAIALYREWNAKINVISRKDIDNIFEHHFLHSLAILEYLGGPIEGTVLDIGTGGGFPGIPLAMACPGARFTLCDSIGKKIKVASEVASGVGLKNVEFRNCRAEEIREEFDWVVSRAVTGLENFYPWAKGKYRKGILCLKGGDVESEIFRMCRKFNVDRRRIKVWPINEWLSGDYFEEKFVICMEK